MEVVTPSSRCARCGHVKDSHEYEEYGATWDIVTTKYGACDEEPSCKCPAYVAPKEGGT